MAGAAVVGAAGRGVGRGPAGGCCALTVAVSPTTINTLVKSKCLIMIVPIANRQSALAMVLLLQSPGSYY